MVSPVPRYACLLVLAILLETGFLALAFSGDLRRSLVETILLVAALTIIHVTAVFAAVKGKLPAGGPALAIIGFAALGFRLTVFPLAPAFSDDVYRYRWEGKVQAAGLNPYRTAPSDPAAAGLRDATYPWVGQKHARAGYGPVLELVEAAMFRAVAHLPDPFRQAFWFKLPAALADLGTGLTLAFLLKTMHLPPERVLVYAWAPLPVFEFWINGHNDSLLLLGVVLAVLALAGARYVAASAALTLAALTKFWPAALFPLLFRRWRWQLLLLPALTAVCLWPYRSSFTLNLAYLSGFLGGWRNNDSLFGLTLAAAAGDPQVAKWLTALLFGAAILAMRRLDLHPAHALLATPAVLLALSANVHPWYLTWLLPGLVLVPSPALLLWVSAAPFFYDRLPFWIENGDWRPLSPLRWAVYIPVYALLAGELLRFVRLREPRQAGLR